MTYDIIVEVRPVTQWQSKIPFTISNLEAQERKLLGYYPGIFCNWVFENHVSLVMPALSFLNVWDRESGGWSWQNRDNLYQTAEEAMKIWEDGDREILMGYTDLREDFVNKINELGLYRTGQRPPIIDMKTVEPIEF